MFSHPMSPMRAFGFGGPVYHYSSHSSSHRRRTAVAVRRKKEPPFVFESETQFFQLMTSFLFDGTGKANRWDDFQVFFTTAPLSFSRKIFLLQKITASSSYDWLRCRQLINNLPEKCSYRKLITLVVPLYFATYNRPTSVSLHDYQ